MEKKKLKISKLSLILLILFAFLYVIEIGVLFLLLLSKDFGNWFWLHVRNPIVGLFFKIFEVVPKIGLNIGHILTWVLFILIILLIIASVFRKLKGRNIIYNVSLALIPAIIVFHTSNVLNYSTNFYTSLIDRIHMEDKVDKEYGEEDIVALYDSLLNKVMEMSLEFDRDSNGEIIYDKSLEETAIKDLKNISDDYPFLKGLYPKKFDVMTTKDMYSGGFAMGLTSGFGIAIDYSAAKASLLNTITHELCHTKGIMRENEAVYCSFIAGINSDNKLSQYAAYLEAFLRVDYAYRDVDPEDEFLRVEPLFKLCMDEHFREICEMYPKTTNGYLKGTKKLEFISYPLIDYKEHVGELIGVISSLQEDGGKIYIDGAEADMDYIFALIKNDSYRVVRVEFDNSNETYQKVEEAMKTSGDLFLAIQQFTPNDDEEDKTPEEYLKYYLKGFNNDNIILDFINTFITEDYSYSRVVRLLLEYYDGVEIMPYEL